MQNVYLEQTEFFKIPSRKDLQGLDQEDIEVAYELASISEVMPDWNDPKLGLNYLGGTYSFRQGVYARGHNSIGNPVSVYFDTETIPLGLILSKEGFDRLVKATHLVGLINYMSYDINTKLISINKTNMKVGKFIKLINPSISDKFLNTVVTEWFAETSNIVTTLVELKASDVYKPGIGPVSCMTGASAVLFWDAVGTTGMTMFSNNRIVARTLLHKRSYYDKVYAYTDEQRTKFITLLEEAGYTPVTKSNCVIDIPINYLNEAIPYLDSFRRIRDTLVI